MATLTSQNIEELMRRGLKMSEIHTFAAQRGDKVPSPTILGEVARPIVTGAVNVSRLVGGGLSALFGADSEKIYEAMYAPRVFKAPLLGSIAVGGRQSELSGQGLESAGFAFPVGRVANVLKPIVRAKPLATGLSLGTAGYGIESGYNLQQGTPSPLTPGLGTAIPAAIPFVAPIFRTGSNVVRGVYAKASGLSPETIQKVLSNPKEFAAAKESGLDRLSLGSLIENRFAGLSKEISETGQAYDLIRKSPNVVKFSESPVPKVLAKFNIGLEDGKLALSKESPALTGGDVSALERFIGQFGYETELSGNAFLNARRGLDDLANFQRDPSKSSWSSDISKALRAEYDTAGKAQMKVLKETDEAYAPIRQEIGNLKKDFLQYKDRQWVMKDTALTKLTNATNKGREQILARLEKYVPGITQQIQLVRALEDITNTQGQKVGTYLQSIVLGGGAGFLASGGNPLVALLAALVTLPQLSIPILIAFGKARGIASSIIRGIVGKIVSGKQFTDQEMMLFRSAVINHLNEISPGDQFFSSPLGKRISAYAGNIKPGLVIEDVSGGVPSKVAQTLRGTKGLTATDIMQKHPDIQLKRVEAQKYKSAEEFVKKQPVVYHGSPIPLKSFSNKKGGAFFTDEYADATGFAGSPDNVYEGYLNFKKPLVIDAKGAKWDELNTKYGKSTQEVVSNAQKEGYDGVTFKNIIDNIADDAEAGLPGTIHYAFNPRDSFLNESQLIDIWNRANQKMTSQAQKLSSDAQKYQPEFQTKVDSAVAKLGLQVEHGPVKTPDRIVEKAVNEKGGDLSLVTDINRSVVFAKDFNSIGEVTNGLKKHLTKEFGRISDVKVTFGNPTYNKTMVNVPTKAGTGEVQITTKALWDAKMKGGGEELYNLQRSPNTPEEYATLLEERMKEVYSFDPEGALLKAAQGALEGGFTRDVLRNVDFSGTPHISVSPFPERTLTYVGETTQKQIADFFKKNFDLLQKKGYAMGGWYNKADGKTYLDVALVVPKKFTSEANQLGKNSNQIATFDLETFKEIATGGTGEVAGVLPLKQRQKMVEDLLSMFNTQ